MRRFGLLGFLALFACACGDDSSSDIGKSGTGGIAGSGDSSTGGASTGGSGGSSTGGTAGASTGGTAGVSTGGTAGATGGPCEAQPSQDGECAGNPPHFYGCFNGAPYDPPAGCVNIYIGNATDFWCCP